MQAQARATDCHAPSTDQTGGGGGPKQDRLERAVIALDAARERLSAVMRWEDVFQRADRAVDADTLRVIRLLYRDGMQQSTLAEELHVDRQTIRRARDRYIGTAAIAAAWEHLVDVEEDEHDL